MTQAKKAARIPNPYDQIAPEIFKTEKQRVAYEWEGTLQMNGAEIIKAKPSDVKGWVVVLARFRNEVVVWNMCEETQEFQSGKYFKAEDANDALDCYRRAC